MPPITPKARIDRSKWDFSIKSKVRDTPKFYNKLWKRTLENSQDPFAILTFITM